MTDVAVSGATDCPDIFAGYARLCDQPETVPKEVASTTQAKGKADAGSVREAKADSGRDKVALAARLAANKEMDAGGCDVMREISARYPPPVAGVAGSGR